MRVAKDSQRAFPTADGGLVSEWLSTQPYGARVAAEFQRRLRAIPIMSGYAYPLASWIVEQSSEPTQCIVTLRTVDGFGVCFSLPRQQQIELGETLVARLAPKITHCAN